MFWQSFLQDYREKLQAKLIVMFHHVQFFSTNTTADQKTLALVRCAHLEEKKKCMEGCTGLVSDYWTVSRPNHKVYWYYLRLAAVRANDKQVHQSSKHLCARLTHNVTIISVTDHMFQCAHRKRHREILIIFSFTCKPNDIKIQRQTFTISCWIEIDDWMNE